MFPGKFEIVFSALEIRAVTAVQNLDTRIRKIRYNFLDILVPAFLDQGDGLRFGQGVGILSLGQRDELSGVFHVGSKTAAGRDDLLAVQMPDHTREGEELDSFFQSDSFDELTLAEADELFVRVFGCSLLEQRPEDVTELADSVECDMAYANFDESPENQVRAAELTLERAMRLTEQKKDVVLLVDSLTRLASACNAAAPANARTLNNGLAAGALNKPKRFFGAARNTREGGSLTIIATMLTDTGIDLDAAICQSFEGNGNMTCSLRQQGANQPILMQLEKCVTVHDEWLLSDKEQAIAQKLREMIKDLSAAEAMNTVLPLFAQAETNDALESLLNT